MGLLSRLKRLWELSGMPTPDQKFVPGMHFAYKMADEPTTTAQTVPVELTIEEVQKPRGMARIVQEPPLDIFQDESEPGDKPATNA